METGDAGRRYGFAGRALHWGMALLLGVQFLSVLSRVLLKDTAIEAFLWPLHKPNGFLLLVLVIVRIIWALASMKSRPPAVSTFSKAGHAAMYALVLIIPTLALLRQYGSGRAFSPFGLPLFPGFEGRVEWMMKPASLFHGWLGWALLALIAGHVFMAFWHRGRGRSDVFRRMW
ncbi:MAG TPA: cytochrome b [Wenzhouxiangella sp.]|nr:cytochrome b [Wenzhouxiangella sp.]